MRRRRWPKRSIIGLAGFLVLFHLAGGWYFSGVIDERALDGGSMRASLDPDYDLVVLSAGRTAVELAPMEGEDGPAALYAEGIWGLRWDGGYGQVTTVLARDGEAVARQLKVLEGSPPAVGAGAGLDPRAYPGSLAGLDLDVRDVEVPGPLGSYPAWFVEGAGDTWVVVVHGNSMSRLDNVRWLPALHDAGYPTLTITYRNDAGAPEDPSGKLRYGLTEWEDLEAAVEYALGEGSNGVVLLGDSMGGGVIAAFLQRSSLAARVTAVVLDSPMLDFSRTVDDNASREPLVGPINLPPTLTLVAKQLAALRFGVDWPSLDYLTAGAAQFDVPTLVFHGEDDQTVPISTSRDLASLRPEDVMLVACPGADHIECWNLDRASLEAQLRAFLRSA